MSKRALVLGWFRSRPKHLEKYRELYSSLGYDAVALGYPTLNAISPSRWQKLRESPPKFVTEKFDVVHLFSGACLIYYNALLSPHFNWDHKCIVYDSGPYLPTSAHIVHYFQNLGASKNALTRSTMIGNGMQKLVDMVWALQGFQAEKELKQYLEVLTCTRPKLLLNSYGDRIVLHKDVAKFVELCTKRGSEVNSHYFENSSHASHYRVHPKEYKEILSQFLQKHIRDTK